MTDAQRTDPPSMSEFREYLRKGDPWVWACAASSGIVLLLFFTLVVVVAVNGLRTFWAPDIAALAFEDGSRLFGAITDTNKEDRKLQLYLGNRDLYGLDYRWVSSETLQEKTYPEDIALFERVEKGNFIGLVKEVQLQEAVAAPSGTRSPWTALNEGLAGLRRPLEELEGLQGQLGQVSKEMESLRLRLLKAEEGSDAQSSLRARRRAKQEAFDKLNAQLDLRRRQLRENVVIVEDSQGRTNEIALMDIVRVYRPNQMNLFSKLGLYFSKIKELLLDYPRESNTEGGLFPAIFGTVLMVMLMSLFGVPLGVVAAVYLREYAKEGWLVNLVRIAVNNLAGVPSIVYGIFGLGFFVYGIGGTIDDLFFPERLPIPTFGTGGLLWASLTMALLTVPVVIVSTEEGLSSVPQGVRDGSLALGATKLQTLVRVVLPMATPGILTGLILAIARAAGEVAPLMLVGVVKIVPSLAVENQFPYLHLERKFMHLGFHIFDVGFQSPNVEAAKPMVYITTLLLIVLVLGMSFLAMYLRNRMKKRYTLAAF